MKERKEDEVERQKKEERGVGLSVHDDEDGEVLCWRDRSKESNHQRNRRLHLLLLSLFLAYLTEIAYLLYG